MKLISMVDFVLEKKLLWNEDDNPDCQSSSRYIKSTSEYAKFLKQPITLSMFLPCDKNGIPNRPKAKELAKGVFNYTQQNFWDQQNPTALDNILFKGVTKRYFEAESEGSYALDVNGYQVGYYKAKPKYWVGMDKTVEDLVGLDIELTKAF